MKDSARGFLVFVSLFLSVYGLAHCYIWWRLLKPLELSGVALRLLQGALVVLFVSFPLIHFWFRHENGWWIGAVNWLSSLWMGTVVYAVLVTLASDLLRLAVFRTVPDGPTVSGVVAAVAAVIVVYGVIEARQLGVTELRVPMPALTKELRVVQISDVHMGLVVRGSRLEQIVNKANSLRPDLIVITGDLVDAEALHMEEMIPLLRRLRAPLGVYAVTGNHEFFAGVDKVERFLQQAGVTLLRNRAVVLDGGLQLVGLDDPIGHRFYGQPPPLVSELIQRGRPTMLLLHTPVTTLDRLEAAGVHLQLSGHTHKGQLWPFHLIVKLIYRHTPYGLLSNGRATIYVSRGAGTWGPPMRVGAPPEITLVTLTPKRP